MYNSTPKRCYNFLCPINLTFKCKLKEPIGMKTMLANIM